MGNIFTLETVSVYETVAFSFIINLLEFWFRSCSRFGYRSVFECTSEL